MRPMRWLTCLAIAGLLVACDDATTDPKASDTETNFKVDRYDEVTSFEDIGYVGYIPCANDGDGELMEYRGTVTFNRTIMDTPSAIQQRTNRWSFTGLPSEHSLYMGPDYVLIGLSSGDVWAVDDNRSNFLEKRHNFDDGTWGYHQTMNMKLRRADGEKLHLVGTYDLKLVDGEWKMFHVNRGACPEIW